MGTTTHPAGCSNGLSAEPSSTPASDHNAHVRLHPGDPNDQYLIAVIRPSASTRNWLPTVKVLPSAGALAPLFPAGYRDSSGPHDTDCVGHTLPDPAYTPSGVTLPS